MVFTIHGSHEARQAWAFSCYNSLRRRRAGSPHPVAGYPPPLAAMTHVCLCLFNGYSNQIWYSPFTAHVKADRRGLSSASIPCGVDPKAPGWLSPSGGSESWLEDDAMAVVPFGGGAGAGNAFGSRTCEQRKFLEVGCTRARRNGVMCVGGG